MLLFATTAIPTFAQSDDSAVIVSQCESKLVSYGSATTSATSLDVSTAKGGRLYYFGAQHSSDPSDAQFATIDKLWAEVKPTVAFYEGPNRPTPSERNQAIKETGESGYVRFLATRDGARIARLEPNPVAESQYVMEKFPPEQVELFYFAREAARLRERKGATETEIKQSIAELQQRAAKMGMKQTLTTVQEIQTEYVKHFSEPAEWWQAPSNWFTPNPQDAERSGGKFFHAINRRSSEFRNVNMYRVLTEAVLKGERAFAVVGYSHVPMQAPALQCALSRR